MNKLFKFILGGLLGTYAMAGMAIGISFLFCFSILELNKNPFLEFLVLTSIFGIIVGIGLWLIELKQLQELLKQGKL